VSRHSEAPDPPAWRVIRDQLTGRTAVDLQFDANWRVDDAAVVERASSSRFDVDPARPADASAQARHVFRIVRPNQTVEAQADVSVQGTATHFHLTIDLAVRVNKALHFTKHWAESVPRHLL
jgi:hypothetical protein